MMNPKTNKNNINHNNRSPQKYHEVSTLREAAGFKNSLDSSMYNNTYRSLMAKNEAEIASATSTERGFLPSTHYAAA